MGAAEGRGERPQTMSFDIYSTVRYSLGRVGVQPAYRLPIIPRARDGPASTHVSFSIPSIAILLFALGILIRRWAQCSPIIVP
jgi:hypothetical protein